MGSQEFAKRFEKKYLSLGGKINYNSKVSKIIIKDNKAIGIQLENGATSLADIVVSTSDGRTTIFNMLEGKYTNKEALTAYKTMKLTPHEFKFHWVLIELLKTSPT